MAKPQGSFYEEVGKRIRQARRHVEMTQNALATSVGISRTSLTNIEKGRQPIYLHVLLRIADVLKTKHQHLLPSAEIKVKENPDLARDLKGKPPETQSWIKKVLSDS